MEEGNDTCFYYKLTGRKVKVLGLRRRIYHIYINLHMHTYTPLRTIRIFLFSLELLSRLPDKGQDKKRPVLVSFVNLG